MIPGIVIAIATLIALMTLFHRLNPALAALWSAGVRRRPSPWGPAR
jgi:hypothetical protein